MTRKGLIFADKIEKNPVLPYFPPHPRSILCYSDRLLGFDDYLQPLSGRGGGEGPLIFGQGETVGSQGR